jgi:hypothetical protein
MKSYDWNDPDDRRLAYRESMLGVNRPQAASKQTTRAVDGLIEAAQQQSGYEAHAIGDDASAKSASFWAARMKDRRKALLRIIGRMEYASEETALMESIINHLLETHVPADGGEDARLDTLMNDLRDVRQKAKDREE